MRHRWRVSLIRFIDLYSLQVSAPIGLIPLFIVEIELDDLLQQTEIHRLVPFDFDELLGGGIA